MIRKDRVDMTENVRGHTYPRQEEYSSKAIESQATIFNSPIPKLSNFSFPNRNITQSVSTTISIGFYFTEVVY